MKLTRVIALAVIAASASLGIAQVEAQSLRDAGQPAEFPPSSYTGRQYVDSAGCVFVRAGIDGNITWVPRVTRARQTMCNQQPSLAAARAAEPAPAPAPVRRAQPQTEPQAQPQAQPPRQVATTAPQPVPQRVLRSTSAQSAKPQVRAVRRVPAPAAVPQPAPRPAQAQVAKAVPQPQATPVRRVRAAPKGCAGATGVSARYSGTASGYAVRCGPQTADHVTRVPGTQAVRIAPRAMAAPQYTAPAYTAAPRPTAVPAYAPVTAPTVPRSAAQPQVVRVDPVTTRVAPRHVARSQARAAQGVSIPEGYKRVWMDGRLNPHRAHQTFAGKAQMDMMWTQTLPRRLILTDSGRDVSRSYPGLIYPYTSYEQQRAAMTAPATAQAYGHAQPRGVISTKSRQPAAEPVAKVSAPKARATNAAGQSYVQAGVYSSRAQAQQAAQRLAAAGLPARLGSLTRGGQRYSLVLSGPYVSDGAAQTALSRVRGAGFGNARLR
ncbi:SPOR domain-containing protein [Roseovarius nanhaiticus]|uniref:SPOR domain-containing protein n=1 Tax=Roseovarius nanhaiticus TaxID=573024 RepID=UPI002492A983|nr:SPOR domain-containing protein [Roseovarius nanhaiticus]